uniref:Uncharacterized protein n=1 Tax=Setaria italica TaxID=4555 RepID=K3ZPQ9_SETIT
MVRPDGGGGSRPSSRSTGRCGSSGAATSSRGGRSAACRRSPSPCSRPGLYVFSSASGIVRSRTGSSTPV